MKGFIRILEAIIASLILLATISFFFSVPSETDWDVALLQTDIQDSLIVMDKRNLQNYIINNDKTSIRNELATLLPSTVDFSVILEGIPNPEIFISCACADTDLRTIIQVDVNDKIKFKNREITIRFKNEPIENIDPRADIFFIFGYQDLTLVRSSVDKFLDGGGTIFMLADLPATLDASTEEIFGLQTTTSSGTTTANFYDTTSASTISFKIFDY